MLTLVRSLVLGFAVCAVVYGCLILYFRAERREALDAAWEARGRPGRRDRFVALGLSRHAAWLRPRLAAAVFGVPLVTLILIVYLMET